MVTSLLNEWKHSIHASAPKTQQSPSPFPTHRPKFLGYAISRYIPRQNAIIVNGVAKDVLCVNKQNWADQVGKAAQLLANTSIALAPATYESLNRTTLLAMVGEFYSLNDLSDTFHLPVPFLRDQQHLVRVKEDGPHQLDDKDKKALNGRITRFRRMFCQLLDTILQS